MNYFPPDVAPVQTSPPAGSSSTATTPTGADRHPRPGSGQQQTDTQWRRLSSRPERQARISGLGLRVRSLGLGRPGRFTVPGPAARAPR